APRYGPDWRAEWGEGRRAPEPGFARREGKLPWRCRSKKKGAHGGNMVSPVKATSVRRLVPGLEILAEVVEEAARERPVDEAVVVREGQVHDRADRDHVLAAIVLDHPRPLDDGVSAEDRRLRLADHRRSVERAVAAGIRDRE